MKRTLDAAPFNIIAAHPDVRPWLGYGLGACDLTPLVSDPNNFCFLTDAGDGGYIVVKLQPGLYSAHTLSLPSARGRPMLSCMREGFATMFLGTDAVEVVTMVPDGNDKGDGWARVAGFRETFRREAFFPLGSDIVGGSFRSLTYQDWVLRDRDNHRRGVEFHELLESVRPHSHADDDVHDFWVGATIRATERGNLAKGVFLYNRWAAQAGYVQASIISNVPPCIDIGDAIVQMVGDVLEVLKVK